MALSSESDQAREKALRFLEYRDRSRREVQERLTRYGVADGLITEVCDRLTELGLLDDERFALRYATAKLHAAWGDRRIRSELLRKGVADDVIESVLLEVHEAGEGAADTPWPQALDGAGGRGAPPAGRATLADVVLRRFGREYALDPARAERRASGFLARRGHDWGAIRQVLAEVKRRAEAAMEPHNNEP